MKPGLAAAAGALLLLSGCMVGPDYRRPSAPLSATFKEQPGWQLAKPADTIDRGAWWSVYQDPLLDGLERELDVSNQTIKQAEAAYTQSQAIVQEVRGELFPTVTVTPGATLSHSGGGNGSVSSVTNSGGTSFGRRSGSGGVFTSYSAEANGNWDIDVWGRIRRAIESDVAAAQASAADIANARLSAQAALATDYFDLRAADALQRLLEDTVAQYERSLQITQNQYDAGVAARSDVITAETQLLSTRAQAVNAGVARAQFEHAIAVLTGHPPADLTIVPAPLAQDVPVPPPVVPALLLERRPDIAAAERTLEQENALIGVAIAAYYPDVTLSGLFGYVGNPIGSLISASNQLWSLGASATETVFQGGTLVATTAAARAAYAESVAAYRQTVLTALQQTEDQLSNLRILREQAAAEDAAVRSARQAVQIALNEYRAGTQAYTTVVTAQATALADEESALVVQQDRLLASVALIQALGGGWDVSQLPSKDELQKGVPFIPSTTR